MGCNEKMQDGEAARGRECNGTAERSDRNERRIKRIVQGGKRRRAAKRGITSALRRTSPFTVEGGAYQRMSRPNVTPCTQKSELRNSKAGRDGPPGTEGGIRFGLTV